MNARKKKVLTVLFLGSALLAWRAYIVITQYVIPSKSRAEANVASVYPPAGETPPAKAAPTLPAAVLQQQAAVAEQPWGRDPFALVPEARVQPAAAGPEQKRQDDRPAPQAPSLKFTGVSKSDGQWLAVVGDKIVRIGDELGGGFTVAEITKRSLTIVSGKWAFQYELGVDQPVTRLYGEEP